MKLEGRRGKLLYEGKAKRVWEFLSTPSEAAGGSGGSRFVEMEFKDSLTAGNGKKLGSFSGKGRINRNVSAMIFSHLSARGISSHWMHSWGEASAVCRKMQMIPLEVVVRNRVAGSLRRLGEVEGKTLVQPIVELYWKDDALGDPLVTESQLEGLGKWDVAEARRCQQQALKVNEVLSELMGRAGMILVDFKLEFGRGEAGELLLGDEFSPDGCRLWRQQDLYKLDKDRFRLDLGDIDKAYVEVEERIRGATLAQ